MSVWRSRLRWLLAVVGGLVLLVGVAGVWGWWQMRRSLPPLDGGQPVAGLAAPVKIERDALGVPTITGANRSDVARALGFLHAQDRFFQMDLLRRRGAGELSELFGRAALDLDREARLHGFRRTAGQVVAAATPAERALLAAYTAGVNAGLKSLSQVPWEYLVIRTAPQPWRDEDTLLCFYAMWFDLQDYRGNFERNREALRASLGQAAVDFLAPRGNSWDAALDGSAFPAAPLPPLRFKPAEEAAPGLAMTESPTKRVIGSNAFALAGAHTATGAAMLANDMHLDHNLPQIWYRAVLQWSDEHGPHRLVGVTLPGTPLVTVGSNGRVAWGFTDAYVDTTDVITVAVEPRANSFYQTPDGWKEIEDRPDPIKLKGGETVPFTARWTRWGPFIDGPKDGQGLVLRWTAHDPQSTNLHFLEIEQAQTVAEAVAIVHRAGIPNENTLIADAAGNIAWTIIGSVPRRVGYDGRLPVSWGYGDRRWDGYLAPEEIPTIATQPGPAETRAKEGALWSGNNRAIGGDGYARLGDSGYDEGARGGQIRDDLRALIASGKKAVPADLLAIQLDERTLFLARWQKFLFEVLNDEAVSAKKGRAELREVARTWNGHASTDSAAYRLVRAFRLRTAELAFGPFTEMAQHEFAGFSWRNFRYDDALWQLVHEQPKDLLDPRHASWNALLLTAVDDVIATASKEGPLANYTWGRRNRLVMRHPFSSFLPKPLAQLLDMPAVALPGDSDMPRVEGSHFGQSERLVVSPGHEDQAIFNMPGGQSGHPLSPFYRAGHDAWVQGQPTPLLPGPTEHTLLLTPL